MAQKLKDADYRKSYIGAHVRQFLARQIRELRGDETQADFGKRIDKAQNVVSRLEDPAYGKATLSTLLDIAAKLDRALIVRFVDFKTYLKLTEDQSNEAAAPAPYDELAVSEFAWKESLEQRRNRNAPLPLGAQRYESPQNALLDDLVMKDGASQQYSEDGEVTVFPPLLGSMEPVMMLSRQKPGRQSRLVPIQ